MRNRDSLTRRCPRAQCVVWLLTAGLTGRCVAAGANSCEACHPAQSKNYLSSSMSHALQRPEASPILKNGSELRFSEGAYRTNMTRDERGWSLTVTDGKEVAHLPVRWAFGLGSAGQTYILERAGELYESRVSYYNDVKGLDLTLGARAARPATLMEAAGRRMNVADVRECFGCHSSGGIRKDKVLWEDLRPGVSCANCHAGAEEHAKQRTSGARPQPTMQKLGRFSAEETNELCGRCHRTWAQVVEMKVRGPLNVRFQPYRITNSKCFDADDRRIGCTACHDPHAAVTRAPESYDTRCFACHAGSTKSKAKTVCRVAAKGCVSCHMPKVDLPDAHFRFTDHQIRVARSGEAYPN
jgi:hypothetical protein